MFKIAGAIETKPEKIVELYLERGDDGKINLKGKVKGRGEYGSTWYILRFNDDGTFYRERSIASDIGIAIDICGRIKEAAE